MAVFLGQIVLYNTTAEEKQRMASSISKNEKSQLAAIIVGINSGSVNIRVFEDGVGDFHKKNVMQGLKEGQYI